MAPFMMSIPADKSHEILSSVTEFITGYRRCDYVRTGLPMGRDTDVIPRYRT